MTSDPPPPDRESIWSISPRWRTAYFVIFVTQNVAGISLVCWNHIFRLTEDGAVETLLNISRDAGQTTIGSAGVTLTITEGARLIMVLGEQLQRWFRQREDRRVDERVAERVDTEVAERVAEVRAEERAEAQRQIAEARSEAQRQVDEARVEERAEVQGQVAEWDRRRREAEAKGEPFDEPLPNFDSNGASEQSQGPE